MNYYQQHRNPKHKHISSGNPPSYESVMYVKHMTRSTRSGSSVQDARAVSMREHEEHKALGTRISLVYRKGTFPGSLGVRVQLMQSV